MNQYPKRIKRQLRELAMQAHENELSRELAGLAEKFDEWREGKIGAGKLSHLVHRYDTGPSRELYKQYNGLPADMLVAYAVAHGILREEEISAEVRPYIQDALKFYRSRSDKEEKAEEPGTE